MNQVESGPKLGLAESKNYVLEKTEGTGEVSPAVFMSDFSRWSTPEPETEEWVFGTQIEEWGCYPKKPNGGNVRKFKNGFNNNGVDLEMKKSGTIPTNKIIVPKIKVEKNFVQVGKEKWDLFRKLRRKKKK